MAFLLAGGFARRWLASPCSGDRRSFASSSVACLTWSGLSGASARGGGMSWTAGMPTSASSRTKHRGRGGLADALQACRHPLVTLPRPCTFDPRYSCDERRVLRTAFFSVLQRGARSRRNESGPQRLHKDQRKVIQILTGSAANMSKARTRHRRVRAAVARARAPVETDETTLDGPAGGPASTVAQGQSAPLQPRETLVRAHRKNREDRRRRRRGSSRATSPAWSRKAARRSPPISSRARKARSRPSMPTISPTWSRRSARSPNTGWPIRSARSSCRRGSARPISTCGRRAVKRMAGEDARAGGRARPARQALRRSRMVVEPVLRFPQAGLSAHHRTGPTSWSRTPTASIRTPGTRPSSTCGRSPTRSRRRTSC